MSINKAIISGEVTSLGAKFALSEHGKPQCSFTLVSFRSDGQYKTFVPVVIVGKSAEEVAASINPGDVVLVEGQLSWKSGRGTPEQGGRLQVVAFDVEKLTSAAINSRN
jgi:single-stranded DNA-binding protein